MATNPKLEFYKFKLDHKKGVKKTFKDFAIEELKGDKSITNGDAFKLCFTNFYKILESDHAKDIKRKKLFTVINDPSLNLHLDKKPIPNITKNYFYGVVNGGPYGQSRIISDIADKKKSSALGADKSVLYYYYIFVYLPSNHNEGFFMIHSNGSDSTITAIFRSYISTLFKGKDYNKVTVESFCPMSFQKEFRDGAIVKSVTYATSVLDNTHSKNGQDDILNEYDLKIELIPKNKKVLMSDAKVLVDKISQNIFVSGAKQLVLNGFSTKKLRAENEKTKTPKIFEWNTRDKEFVPVVYLRGRVKFIDDTPDFDALKSYCINMFEEEIINELRPDLNVTKLR